MKKDSLKNDSKKWSNSFIRFVYVISTLILLLLGGIFYKLYQNDMTQVDQKEQDKNLYYDEFFNFSIMLPKGWEAIAPDKLDEYKAVKETTGGVVFDVRGHSLKREVVPLTVIKNSKDKKTKYAKFMTLALRGTDQDLSFMKDYLSFKDSFTSLLKKLEHKDIKVKSVGILSKERSNVVVLKGEGVLQNKKIYYTQWFEPVGSNLIIVTHGSTTSYKEGVKDIESFLSTLQFYEGGAFMPEPVQEEMKKEFEKKWGNFENELSNSTDSSNKNSNDSNKSSETTNDKNDGSTNSEGNKNQNQSSPSIKLPTQSWGDK